MYCGESVVVGMPAYNESANIATAVTSFLNQEWVDDVVVVDNNSTDGTAKLAEEAGAVVIREPNQGYGYACRRALAEANEQGDLLVLVEPDGTFAARTSRNCSLTPTTSTSSSGPARPGSSFGRAQTWTHSSGGELVCRKDS